MGGLFSSPKPPEIKTATAAPIRDPQDPELIEQRRRRIEAMRARGGRLSTILSDEIGTGGKLGG